MQTAMDIRTLLTTASNNAANKLDFLANTKTDLKLFETESGLKVNLAKPDGSFDRDFGITELAAKQLSTRMNIPVKYFIYLQQNHPDLLIGLVNELFDREPVDSFVRTLNGDARAFLSSKYKTMDNDTILEAAYEPLFGGEYETYLLSSNITDRAMSIKVLFPDVRLEQAIGNRVIHPMITLGNSEIGQGSFSGKIGFYDHYCTNGQVFGGMDDQINFRRTHVGGRLIQGNDFTVISNDTRDAEKVLLGSQVTDLCKTVTSVEFATQMGDTLRAAAESTKVVNPEAAVEAITKELGIFEGERSSILESFIKEQDYSKFGMSNAITQVANDPELASYDRAGELEQIGGRVIGLNDLQWNRFANTVKVAA